MMKPLHNYVLLTRLNEESKTAGGIIIPDNAKEKPSRGRVVAVGDGVCVDADEPEWRCVEVAQWSAHRAVRVARIHA